MTEREKRGEKEQEKTEESYCLLAQAALGRAGRPIFQLAGPPRDPMSSPREHRRARDLIQHGGAPSVPQLASETNGGRGEVRANPPPASVDAPLARAFSCCSS